MLFLILFCKLIDAATKSEKKAVAALTNEFMEPFSSMKCLENPDPDILLWNDIDYIDDPEAQDKPDYEHITLKNYKEKLKDKENFIFLNINEVSQMDKINVQKIKQIFGEGATVLSMDPCLRPEQNSFKCESNPEVRLWHDIGYPETQFMPTYEVINGSNYEQKLQLEGRNKDSVWLEANYVEGKLNLHKVKLLLKDKATILSREVCLRDGDGQMKIHTLVYVLHKNRTNEYREVSLLSLISADNLTFILSLFRKL